MTSSLPVSGALAHAVAASFATATARPQAHPASDADSDPGQASTASESSDTDSDASTLATSPTSSRESSPKRQDAAEAQDPLHNPGIRRALLSLAQLHGLPVAPDAAPAVALASLLADREVSAYLRSVAARTGLLPRPARPSPVPSPLGNGTAPLARQRAALLRSRARCDAPPAATLGPARQVLRGLELEDQLDLRPGHVVLGEKTLLKNLQKAGDQGAAAAVQLWLMPERKDTLLRLAALQKGVVTLAEHRFGIELHSGQAAAEAQAARLAERAGNANLQVAAPKSIAALQASLFADAASALAGRYDLAMPRASAAQPRAAQLAPKAIDLANLFVHEDVLGLRVWQEKDGKKGQRQARNFTHRPEFAGKNALFAGLCERFAVLPRFATLTTAKTKTTRFPNSSPLFFYRDTPEARAYFRAEDALHARKLTDGLDLARDARLQLMPQPVAPSFANIAL